MGMAMSKTAKAVSQSRPIAGIRGGQSWGAGKRLCGNLFFWLDRSRQLHQSSFGERLRTTVSEQ